RRAFGALASLAEARGTSRRAKAEKGRATYAGHGVVRPTGVARAFPASAPFDDLGATARLAEAPVARRRPARGVVRIEPERDVVAQRVREKKRLLRDEADGPAHRGQSQIAYVDTVDAEG